MQYNASATAHKTGDHISTGHGGWCRGHLRRVPPPGPLGGEPSRRPWEGTLRGLRQGAVADTGTGGRGAVQGPSVQGPRAAKEVGVGMLGGLFGRAKVVIPYGFSHYRALGVHLPPQLLGICGATVPTSPKPREHLWSSGVVCEVRVC